MTTRVGLGYDIHPYADDDRPLVLAGVAIDGHRGLSGHSDADVVAHAVADALLGPAGLPDLGTLFPSSDDRHRDASSMELLTDVVARVRAAGWRIGNVDVVVNAEEPPLAAHTRSMEENLAAVVGGHVSVTPKRGEGVGEVGRGSAAQVWAVALLERGG